jgi:hypothetical protein
VADLVGQCQSRKSRTNAYYSKLSRSLQRAIVKRGAKCGVGHGESKRGGEIEIERDDISGEAIEGEQISSERYKRDGRNYDQDSLRWKYT